MNIGKKTVLTVLVTAAAVRAAEILFAGLALNGAPSFEKEFDRVLRENLQGTRGIGVADQGATDALLRKIDFGQYTALSRELQQRIAGYADDTAVLVWGRIRDFSYSARRRNLVSAVACGDLTITLNIYSMRLKSGIFTGDVVSHAEIPKGLIWFYSVDNLVHITAADKEILAGKLVADAAKQAAATIAAAAVGDDDKARGAAPHRRTEGTAVPARP